MKRRVFIFSLIVSGLFFYSFTFAATADHVVISQIQIDSVAGVDGTADESVTFQLITQ